MRTIYILAVFICLGLNRGFVYSQLKAYPRNEMYKDSSLTAFVCKLQYAVFKKDKLFILSVVDDNIKNTFGDSNGKDAFKAIWELDKENSSLWFYLSKLISLGGTYSKYERNAGFVFPYVFNMDIKDEKLDPFSILAITGENVNVREKPDKNSRVLGHLSYDIVLWNSPGNEPDVPVNSYGLPEWYFITTQDKKISGYVYWDYVWSPVGYRLFLDKMNGEWKITCLIAGD